MLPLFPDERFIPSLKELPAKGKRPTVALIYPHSYYLGMSYLGLQAVYGLMLERSAFIPHLLFCDDEGVVYRHPGELRAGYRPPDLRRFDLLAFSLPYELGYINLLRVLTSQGIPVLASERSRLPLVVAGGYAVTMNPEPLAEMIDLAYLGEAEGGFESFLSALAEEAGALRAGRAEPGKYELLRAFHGKPGFYLPMEGMEQEAIRHATSDLDALPAYSRIIAEHTSFPRRHLVQIARGCTAKCRFCLAGHVTRPLRFLSGDAILEIARRARGITDRLGIISASPSDHPQIRELTRTLVDDGFRLSFSSLRLSSIDDEMLACLLNSGQQTVTIAPEVLDEEHRKVIAKPFPSNSVILQRTRDFLHAGVRRLKFYYMLGFDFEDDAYIRRLGAFLSEIGEVARSVRPGRSVPSVTFSFSYFVPKPQTPLELAPMPPVAELKRRRKLLKKHIRGVCSLKFESAERALLQEALSRGGRDAFRLLRFLSERPFRTDVVRRAIAAFGLEAQASRPQGRWPRVAVANRDGASDAMV